MKKRKGYVSNSSSSSFIVAFPKVPESAEETFDIMFPGMSKDSSIASYSTPTPCTLVAEIVYGDIQNQLGKTTTLPVITDEAKLCLSVDGDIDLIIKKCYPNHEYDNWDLYQYLSSLKERMLYGEDDDGDLLKDNPNAHIFNFSYADEDGGLWSNMEHGDIFRNLPHKRESHH